LHEVRKREREDQLEQDREGYGKKPRMMDHDEFDELEENEQKNLENGGASDYAKIQGFLLWFLKAIGFFCGKKGSFL
jgi:hypothetical protein